MAEKLREFQISFGKYLRDPDRGTPLPGISPRRARVYEELLFSNMSGFIDSCFPVCRKLVDPPAWRTLLRDFFRDWRCQTPYFSDIPGEFLQYLSQREYVQEFPPWFFELAHYEWVELNLETSNEEDSTPVKTEFESYVYSRSAVRNLVYNWPVHQISEDFQPEIQQQTFLVVLRSKDFDIRFIEINSATSSLISVVQEEPLPRRRVLEKMSKHLKLENDTTFRSFCNSIIDDLIEKEVFDESSHDTR